MKPFKLIWKKENMKVPIDISKNRYLGISYEKRFMVSRVGIENILVFYLWKKYRVFAWVS